MVEERDGLFSKFSSIILDLFSTVGRDREDGTERGVASIISEKLFCQWPLIRDKYLKRKKSKDGLQ